MNVAFIPVRGGSKSIPLKNIKLLNEKPLVYWVIKAACECNYIDKVYVSTDSKEIRTTVELFASNNCEHDLSKVDVIGRSEKNASDTASTEAAMLEFAENYMFDNIVLIQATSPLLKSKDLDKGFELFMEETTDSVLSVVLQKRFQWEQDAEGFAHATNYDIYRRPRRQEYNGYYVENGAFYITSKERLMKSGNRISGNIKMVEMDEDTFFEIDEPSDWTIIEALMKKKEIVNVKKFSDVKMFLTDCDGCLTDGGMYYSEQGDELKKFNTKDGMAFGLLQEKGIITGIITGEKVELNRRRAEKLHVDILEQGCKNKAKTIKRICDERGIPLEKVVYIGDDINDLEAIKLVGYGCAPYDAMEIIKNAAKYVASAKGGAGVIREIVQRIIEE